VTTAVVVMIGAGLLLIISAIEDSSIVATFQALWSGQPLTAPTAATGSSTKSTSTKGSNPVASAASAAVAGAKTGLGLG
jgi:hypothetical protein